MPRGVFGRFGSGRSDGLVAKKQDRILVIAEIQVREFRDVAESFGEREFAKMETDPDAFRGRIAGSVEHEVEASLFWIEFEGSLLEELEDFGEGRFLEIDVGKGDASSEVSGFARRLHRHRENRENEERTPCRRGEEPVKEGVDGVHVRIFGGGVFYGLVEQLFKPLNLVRTQIRPISLQMQ